MYVYRSKYRRVEGAYLESEESLRREIVEPPCPSGGDMYTPVLRRRGVPPCRLRSGGGPSEQASNPFTD